MTKPNDEVRVDGGTMTQPRTVKLSELLELAERCEKATGPDRELDGLIDATLRIGKANHPEWIRKNFPVWRARPNGRVEVVGGDGTGGVHWESANFTASIDAAMTLVPDGWPIENMSWWPSVPAGYESERCCRLTVLELDRNGFGGTKRFKAEAKTPALALCAASLRAIATTTAPTPLKAGAR